MDPWVVAVAAVLVAVTIGPGLYFFLPGRKLPDMRMQLGLSLLTGAATAFAVLVVQVVFDARLRRIDERREAQAQRQDLQLLVGRQQDLSGINLEGQDLSRFYIPNKVLREARLADVDLTAAVLARSDLARADLRRAKLPEADLRRATLKGAQLEAADLTEVDARGASLDRADLRRALLSGAELLLATAPAQLADADLSEAELTAADLRGADLRRAKLRGAELELAQLEGADLTGADLGGASLRWATYDADTIWPKVGGQRPCQRGTGSCRVGANAAAVNRIDELQLLFGKRLPRGWKTEPDDDDSQPGNQDLPTRFQFTSPDRTKNFIGITESFGGSSKAYFDASRTNLRKLRAYRELEIVPVRLLRDTKGFVLRFTWNPPTAVQQLTQLQLYFAEEGYGYVFTFTSALAAAVRAEREAENLFEAVLVERED